jgi:hypothetical protein
VPLECASLRTLQRLAQTPEGEASFANEDGCKLPHSRTSRRPSGASELKPAESRRAAQLPGPLAAQNRFCRVELKAVSKEQDPVSWLKLFVRTRIYDAGTCARAKLKLAN